MPGGGVAGATGTGGAADSLRDEAVSSGPQPERASETAAQTARKPADAARRALSGADGIRTHDLRIANATLSQLSYGPERTLVSGPLEARSEDGVV